MSSRLSWTDDFFNLRVEEHATLGLKQANRRLRFPREQAATSNMSERTLCMEFTKSRVAAALSTEGAKL